MDLSTPEDRRHMLQILGAAVQEAERNRAFRCADALRQADRLLRLSGSADLAALDELLTQAMNHVTAIR